MARKRHKAKEIVNKLRQADVCITRVCITRSALATAMWATPEHSRRWLEADICLDPSQAWREWRWAAA